MMVYVQIPLKSILLLSSLLLSMIFYQIMIFRYLLQLMDGELEIWQLKLINVILPALVAMEKNHINVGLAIS